MNKNAYLPILRLPEIKLRGKLQEKLHRVTVSLNDKIEFLKKGVCSKRRGIFVGLVVSLSSDTWAVC